ncbi:MAG: hypothetical protein PHV00_05990 [Syntrophales bacterium]|jgi:hypothetical protein|nr:hypothetical protein [Syntrophales bacterium]
MPQAPVQPTTERQTTPDLDRVMTDGRAPFDGAAGAPDAPEPIVGPAAEADLLVGAPGDDLTPPPDPATPPVAGTPEPPAAPQTPTPPTPPTPPAETLRFTSHEEAERGYKHLQREKTLSDQRALALEEELRRIKADEQLAQAREAEERSFTDFAQARNEQALKEIDEIDPDDPDYRKKAAAAWASANRDIRFWQSNPAERRTQAAPPAVPPAAAPPAAAPPAPAPPADPLSAPAKEAARAVVNERLSAAGIPPDDRLFWLIAQHAPTTDPQGQPIDFEQQIAWALAETKTYRDTLLAAPGDAAAAEAERKAREAQERDLPLGRSAATPPAAETPTRPVSMTDAITFAQERRRL